MANEIAKVTAQIIYSLYNNGNLDKAVLASLRHAVTIKDNRAENVWPIMFSKMAASDISSDPQGRETRQETAIYTALRCFAIYQQGLTELSYASSNQVNAEDKGQQLFVALADLRKNQDKQAALDRRIQNLLSSTNIDSVAKSVTQLVRILKSADRNLLLDHFTYVRKAFVKASDGEYSDYQYLYKI